MNWLDGVADASERVDAYFDRRPVRYYSLLFVAPLATWTGAGVLLGDGPVEALTHGIAFAVAFVAGSVLLDRHRE